MPFTPGTVFDQMAERYQDLLTGDISPKLSNRPSHPVRNLFGLVNDIGGNVGKGMVKEGYIEDPRSIAQRMEGTVQYGLGGLAIDRGSVC